MKPYSLPAFFVLLTTASIASAADSAITPVQSLDDDLAGPHVIWLGQIANIIPAGDETCFVLNRIEPIYDGYAFTATKFIACDPSGSSEESFSVGRVLSAEGNLGEDRLRRIGTQEIKAPLIAAPKIVIEPNLTVYRNAPAYPSYPYRPYYYDPFYDPWYPHSGIWFGYHHHH